MRKRSVEHKLKMHIILRCIILFLMILNILCQGKELKNWDISFTPAAVTAVPGLCARISCTFTYPNTAKPKKLLFYQCNDKCDKETENLKVTMLEPDLDKKNCSIIINNIEAENKGKYTFRVEGDQQYTYKTIFKIIIQDRPVIHISPLREGERANLSCSVPFPCPETPPKITWWIKKNKEKFTAVKENITLTTSESFILSTLTFMPTFDLHNATVRCKATYKNNKTIRNSMTIEVMYVTLRILGNDKVNEGDTLSLNCTVDSHPPSSHPIWSFNGSTEKLKNHISAESLTITNVSKLHAGEYVCAVTYMEETLEKSININVIPYTNELETNGTIGQDTAEQNRTGKNIDPQNVTGNTTGLINKGQIHPIQDFLKNLELSTSVLTFLAGIATSAVIFSVVLCCWVSCNRTKKPEVLATPPDSAVQLETVQTNIDSAVNGEQTNEETPLQNQFDVELSSTQVELTGAAEETEAGGADVGDVDYATIDYSLLKKKPPEEEEEETANTEYAEIKRDTKGRKAHQNQDDQVEMSNEGSENQKQNEGEEELYSNSQALKGVLRTFEQLKIQNPLGAPCFLGNEHF